MKSTIESVLQATLILSTVLMTGCITEDEGASDEEENLGVAESGLTDSMGIGAFFQNRQNKPPLSAGRGAGTIPSVCPPGYTEILGTCYSWTSSFPASCPSGKERDGDYCYNPCPLGYYGVGPVCWLGSIGTAVCDALYNSTIANGARNAHRARTFGIGIGAAAFASVSAETGVYYGENGEYGCYTSTCSGAVTDISIEMFASFGDFTGVAALTGDGFDLSIGVGYGVAGYTQSLSFDGSGNVVGFVQQVSLGVGASPIAIGASSCDTTLTQRSGPVFHPPAVGDDMSSNEQLAPGASISSSNGQYRLVYQTDGNLVLYRNSNGASLWGLPISSAVSPGSVIMQSDGNFVAYAANGNAYWSSGTGGSGHRLVVQNDGNVVMYRPNGSSVWATDTMQYTPATGSDMYPGEALSPGSSLTSSNGQYRFVYQIDGNLVLYRNSNGASLWGLPISGPVSPRAVTMQGDGNLVAFAANGNAYWTSGTGGSGDHLVVQNDGNVVMYRPNGTSVWATNTME